MAKTREGWIGPHCDELADAAAKRHGCKAQPAPTPAAWRKTLLSRPRSPAVQKAEDVAVTDAEVRRAIESSPLLARIHVLLERRETLHSELAVAAGFLEVFLAEVRHGLVSERSRASVAFRRSLAERDKWQLEARRLHTELEHVEAELRVLADDGPESPAA